MAGKKLSSTNLSDLVKRVPKNQMKQFEKFRNKTLEYHRRVNQYPDKLPRIDWEYYRSNVRQDFVTMVDEFQSNYEELEKTFDARHEIKDFAKYYDELEKLTEQVKQEVREYIDKSNSHIKHFEDEIERIRNLIPYENMTVEQFIIYREDLADYIPRQGKPLFWPHVPSEQRVGPANPDYDRRHRESVTKNAQTETRSEGIKSTDKKLPEQGLTKK